MEAIQRALENFLQLICGLEDFQRGSVGYREFQEKLWSNLMELGREITRAVLEDHDSYLMEHPEEREGWIVQRGPEEKTILTKFGEVTYKRRYYRHKETGEKAHLVDVTIGMGPHDRIDPIVQAELVAKATNVSYAKAGADQEVPVTKQTVMNVVRRAGKAPEIEIKESPVKRRVKTLYIEADEDHVSLQKDRKGRTLQVPVIYVHEGRSEENGRTWLRGRFYFTGLEDPEELWLKVLDYIDANYDISAIEKIFIGGDGAAWIKTGLKIIPKSIFILDRYHLGKYLKRAIKRAEYPDLYDEAWEAIDQCDRAKFNSLMKAAAKLAETEGHKQAIAACRRYVNNNWHGILSYREHKDTVSSPSAEAHVSHLLSERLSSRPMAWSRLGAGHMARLRVMQGNGIDIQKHYATWFSRWEKGPLFAPERSMRKRRALIQRYYERLQAAIPALAGSRTPLRTALHDLVFPSGQYC